MKGIIKMNYNYYKVPTSKSHTRNTRYDQTSPLRVASQGRDYDSEVEQCQLNLPVWYVGARV